MNSGEELKERTVPQVIVRLWPGTSEQRKIRLAEEIVKDVISILNYGEESVSVAIEEGVHMPARNDALKDRLSRYREINIRVTGRKSGRTISIPVWFVLDDENLYLLPVQGSDTQWYKNVLNNPLIRIEARGAEAEFNAVPVTDSTQVSSVVEKFREKYGARDVKKYYSKFDAAVLAQMR